MSYSVTAWDADGTIRCRDNGHRTRSAAADAMDRLVGMFLRQNKSGRVETVDDGDGKPFTRLHLVTHDGEEWSVDFDVVAE